MIIEISFDKIVPFWLRLWPWHSEQTLEAYSYMQYGGGYFALDYIPDTTYFALLVDDKIVGVNSGHTTPDNLYRSRGLWIEKQYRGKGLGVPLLTASVAKARQLKCDGVWSFPRDTSRKTYEASGFIITSDWIISEHNIKNAYCLQKTID
jgi:GNAT superfamily N-acetyltransferase